MTRTRRPAKTDITLDEELSYRNAMSPPHFTGKHLLEDNGFLLTGETDEHDVFAISMIFNVDGTEWGGKPATMRQTNFMAIPKSQRGKGLTDNDYIGVRSDPVKSLNLSVDADDTQVSWSIGDLTMVAEPPYWTLKGEHAGVDFDVTMGGLQDASRFLGDFKELDQNGKAGVELPCWLEGDLTVDGVKYELQNGIAMHEKVIIGDAWVQGEALRRRTNHYWMWVLSEDVRVFSYVKEATGVTFGHADVGEATDWFGPGQITIDELDHWVDPRTGIQIPSRFAVAMQSPESTVSLTVEAYGRFMYTYCLAGGNITYHGLICRANGTIVSGDTTTEIVDVVTYLENGIYPTPLPVN
ncbi:lipocalin family protein [Mycolicibacterium hodleri]|uniref:AttH domain-containing protein n=1 Tax=Mycolicibacterium hodleri TaxID=49897 RepID=A0A502EHS2_9MYCO|nr:lipocalin family protein [Mycolicibacterium hodleri]TPG36629.1 hypothetical protein EAH80_01350 [Mycolicibacterium hodleri]